MIAALLAGLAAGYGIAIPVGAVAVLIVETGIRSGGRAAAAAGAGAASADGIYAAVAALFGAALAGVLAPWERPLRAVAVVVLAALALHGFRSVARATAGAAAWSGAVRTARPRAIRSGSVDGRGAVDLADVHGLPRDHAPEPADDHLLRRAHPRARQDRDRRGPEGRLRGGRVPRVPLLADAACWRKRHAPPPPVAPPAARGRHRRKRHGARLRGGDRDRPGWLGRRARAAGPPGRRARDPPGQAPSSSRRRANITASTRSIAERQVASQDALPREPRPQRHAARRFVADEGQQLHPDQVRLETRTPSGPRAGRRGSPAPRPRAPGASQ